MAKNQNPENDPPVPDENTLNSNDKNKSPETEAFVQFEETQNQANRIPKDADKDEKLNLKRILTLSLSLTAMVVLIGIAVIASTNNNNQSTDDLIANAENEAREEAENREETESDKPVLVATVNHPAPELDVVDLKENPIKLADYEGKPMMIEFIATWCPHCNKVAPRVAKALKDYPEVEYLMVGSANEPPKKVEAFHKKYNLPGDVGIDSKKLATIRIYQGTGYPTFAFLDRNHKVKSLDTGEPTVASLKAQLKAIVED